MRPTRRQSSSQVSTWVTSSLVLPDTTRWAIGHGPVGADGEDPHQLAQIGAVVLVVAEGDRRGGLAASGPAVRAVVVAGEGHAWSSRCAAREQSIPNERTARRTTSVNRLARSASKSLSRLRPTRSSFNSPTCSGPTPKRARLVGDGPFAQRVDRLVVDDQVAHHHPQRGGRSEAQPAIISGPRRDRQPGLLPPRQRRRPHQPLRQPQLPLPQPSPPSRPLSLLDQKSRRQSRHPQPQRRPAPASRKAANSPRIVVESIPAGPKGHGDLLRPSRPTTSKAGDVHRGIALGLLLCGQG